MATLYVRRMDYEDGTERETGRLDPDSACLASLRPASYHITVCSTTEIAPSLRGRKESFLKYPRIVIKTIYVPNSVMLLNRHNCYHSADDIGMSSSDGAK